MQQQPILAAIDLGSNSFRLQIARIEGDQLYMLDGLREPVHLAAGLTADKYLDAEAQQHALAALGRFAERLHDLPREEARLIYLGVAHGLPKPQDNRLVIDIGGGSTEFIIGSGLTPLKLESLYMGCVSYSLRFSPAEKSPNKT